MIPTHNRHRGNASKYKQTSAQAAFLEKALEASRVKKAMQQSSADVRAETIKTAEEAAVLLSGLFAAYNVSAHAQEQIFGHDSLIMRATDVLSKCPVINLHVSDTTIARQRTEARLLLDAELQRLIQGTNGALVIDGATLYAKKVMVLLWVSAELAEEALSIVLGIYEPDIECDEVNNNL